MDNINLYKAKKIKNDEFYTFIEDIEKEISEYDENIFNNKIVLCNCDDISFSQFYVFFLKNIEKLNIREVIFSNHSLIEKNFTTIIKKDLTIIKECREDNGDFRNEESINLLNRADVVITNPPFSLFRDYINLMMKYDKKFLIIGSINAITCKDIFKYIKEEKIWIGKNFPKKFYNIYNEIKYFGNICWFTNLKYLRENEYIKTNSIYVEDKYPYYDNYDAIEVSKLKEIPENYKGIMGVPITFILKYNKKQFEILGQTSGRYEFDIYPIKKYVKPLQIKSNGKICNGSKVNSRATIKILNTQEHNNYYSASNINYYLKVVYARILIKYKNV